MSAENERPARDTVSSTCRIVRTSQVPVRPEVSLTTMSYVVPGQEPQWMPVNQFATPYPDDDVALDRLIPDLAGRVLAWRWEDARTDLVEPKGDPRLSLTKAWAPATLTHTQASDLLALLAGASGLTTNHEDALTLMTHPWSDLGGETFLTLVRSGLTDAAVCHCIGLTVGALG